MSVRRLRPPCPICGAGMARGMGGWACGSHGGPGSADARTAQALLEAAAGATAGDLTLLGPDDYDYGGYSALAARLDGATFLACAALASSDNGTASASLWYRSDAVAANFALFVADAEGNYLNSAVANGSDETTVKSSWSDAAGVKGFVSDVSTGVAAGAWHHLLISVDVARGTPAMETYIDGVKQPHTGFYGPTGSPGPSTVLAFNGLSFRVGGDSIGDFLTGDLADVWIAPGVSLLDGGGDVPAATLRLFRGDDGAPAYLGAGGEAPTGAAPAVFLSGGASTFAANRGTGGAFSIVGGPLADAAGPP